MTETAKKPSDAQAKKRAERLATKDQLKKVASDPKAAENAKKIMEKAAVQKAKRQERKAAKTTTAADPA